MFPAPPPRPAPGGQGPRRGRRPPPPSRSGRSPAGGPRASPPGPPRGPLSTPPARGGGGGADRAGAPAARGAGGRGGARRLSPAGCGADRVEQRRRENPYEALRRSGADALAGAVPRGAEPPYRVFVNGVPQQEGRDYDVGRGELLFRRPLEKEKLGMGRWTAMFFGLFGSYGKNDQVDVQYCLAYRDVSATGLDIVPSAPTLTRSC